MNYIQTLNRKRIEATTLLLCSSLTKQEQSEIVFIPLLLENIAWRYAEKAMEQARDERVECLKKLSRTIKTVLRPQYERELKAFLDYNDMKRIDSCAEEFIALNATHFARLHFPIGNEFLRHYPTRKNAETQIHGITAKLLVKLAEKYRDSVDRLLIERGITKESLPRTKTISALYASMDAFAGEEGQFDYENKHIVTALEVIMKKIKEIEFEIA